MDKWTVSRAADARAEPDPRIFFIVVQQFKGTVNHKSLIMKMIVLCDSDARHDTRDSDSLHVLCPWAL